MTASPEQSLRIFLDSSVIIAGCISHQGASYALLRLAEVRLVDAYVSPEVREECVRNVRTKAHAALPLLGVVLRETVTQGPTAADDITRIAEPYAHPKDVLILAAAIQLDCAFLVTLNERDFWPPSSLIKIMRPGDLLVAIRKQIGGLSA